MSRIAALLILIIAVLSGLIASAAVMKYIDNNASKPAPAQAAPTVSVVIASKDLPAGTKLREEDYSVVNWPLGSAPEGSFKDGKEVFERRLKTSVYKGEPIMNERLVPLGSPGGLPSLIPKGQRAITLRVDDTISVAGFVYPGHHVDIVTTVDIDNAVGSETISKVILQNIRVIATGREIEHRDEEKKTKIIPTVTILVDLEQAERLSLATQRGAVRLVLRSHDDKEILDTPGVTLSNLIAKAEEEEALPPPTNVTIEEPQPQPEKKQPIIVIRGTEKSEVFVD